VDINEQINELMSEKVMQSANEEVDIQGKKERE
jgi:hypothetical protein